MHSSPSIKEERYGMKEVKAKKDSAFFIVLCVVLVIVAVFAAACKDADAAKFYKWVDKKGVVTYSDMPPSNADHQARGDVTVIRVSGADAGQGAAQGSSDTIFFEQQAEGYLVEVVLNDTVKAKMIVDTGANIVVISEALSKKLRQQPEAKAKKLELVTASGTVSALPVVIRKIRLGSVEKENVAAAIAPAGAIFERCDGLLGLSFLNDFTMSIDNKAGTITMKKQVR